MVSCNQLLSPISTTTHMSPDLNPIEQIWDMLGRRIYALEPPVQIIRQLEAALHWEW